MIGKMSDKKERENGKLKGGELTFALNVSVSRKIFKERIFKEEGKKEERRKNMKQEEEEERREEREREAGMSGISGGKDI